MNLKLFTKEQTEFLRKNVEEAQRIDSLIANLDAISQGTNASETDKKVKSYLIRAYLDENKNKIVENLRPFKERDELFQARKNQIMSQYGFGPTDKGNIHTIRASLLLEKRMREEVSDMTFDLRGKKMSDRETEKVFPNLTQSKPKVLQKDTGLSR